MSINDGASSVLGHTLCLYFLPLVPFPSFGRWVVVLPTVLFFRPLVGRLGCRLACWFVVLPIGLAAELLCCCFFCMVVVWPICLSFRPLGWHLTR